MLVNFLVTLLVYSIASHGSIVQAMVLSLGGSGKYDQKNSVSKEQDINGSKGKLREKEGVASGSSQEKGQNSKDTKSVQSAMESGDWDLALQIARERRETEVTSMAWVVEAEVLIKMGKYLEAKSALHQARKRLNKGSNNPGPRDLGTKKSTMQSQIADRIQKNMDKVEDLSRGYDSREPRSKYRSSEKSSSSALSLHENPPKPKKDELGPSDRTSSKKIVKTWYFWATIGAIAAATVSIAVISIKADGAKQPDALGFVQRNLRMHRPLLAF